VIGKKQRLEYEGIKNDLSMSIEKILHCGPMPNEQLEKELMQWFLDKQKHHLRVKDKFIHAKALSLASTIPGLSDFKASKGYVGKFKNRNDIASRVASNLKPLPPNAPDLVTDFLAQLIVLSQSTMSKRRTY
jgi:hypothetical protein